MEEANYEEGYVRTIRLGRLLLLMTRVRKAARRLSHRVWTPSDRDQPLISIQVFRPPMVSLRKVSPARRQELVKPERLGLSATG